MSKPLLFVYGTLRPGHDGPMANWLRHVARHVGGATALGALYHVDGYPAFVPDEAGVAKGGQRHVIGSAGEYKELAKSIREDNWNDVHIIARGNTIVHLLNGRVMSVLIDDDPAHRAAEGKLGVQVHVGPPMKVEFRDIRLKKL